MAIPSRFIKVELLKRGVTNRDIASRCGVDDSLVSHVIAHRRRSRVIERIIAEIIETPVELVFPPALRTRRASRSVA